MMALKTRISLFLALVVLAWKSHAFQRHRAAQVKLPKACSTFERRRSSPVFSTGTKCSFTGRILGAPDLSSVRSVDHVHTIATIPKGAPGTAASVSAAASALSEVVVTSRLLRTRQGLEMRISRRRSSNRAPGISNIGKAEQRKREREHPDQPYQVYVGNLPWKLSEEELAEFCSAVGRVVVAKIKKDSFTGLSKGYGFVRYSDPIKAVAAVETLSGKELHGRAITVKYANAPASPASIDDDTEETGAE